MPKPPTIIEKEKLLLAEGADCMWFMIWACQAYGREDIQVMDFGGVGSHDLRNFLAVLKNVERYDAVNAIVIARDAEPDAGRAIQSVQDHLRQANLPVPQQAFSLADGAPRTAFMIIPGFHVGGSGNVEYLDGALEHLCLRTVSHDPLLRCVDDYLQCAQNAGEPLVHPHKARLHSFLSGKKGYAGLKLSEAAKAKAWDWDHVAFQPFKEIIQQM